MEVPSDAAEAGHLRLRILPDKQGCAWSIPGTSEKYALGEIVSAF